MAVHCLLDLGRNWRDVVVIVPPVIMLAVTIAVTMAMIAVATVVWVRPVVVVRREHVLDCSLVNGMVAACVDNLGKQRGGVVLAPK